MTIALRSLGIVEAIPSFWGKIDDWNHDPTQVHHAEHVIGERGTGVGGAGWFLS